MNSWVAHANRRIFGDDADEFRPERWLESPERSAEMNRYIMTVSSMPPSGAPAKHHITAHYIK